MRIPTRLVLALALIVAGFVYSCPQWTQECGLDLWNYGESERELRQKEDELAILEEKTPRSNERHLLQMLVVHDLIDGRMRLAEASEQFYTLDVMDPEIMTHTRRQYPAPSERESVARQTIAFVKVELANDPVRCKDVVSHLEEELEAIRAEEATHDH